MAKRLQDMEDDFDDIVVDAPPTQGIKYAGSKLKLLPSILELVSRTQAKTIFDGFAGSTRVSQAFAKSGYRVISNDVAIWSQVFGTCYLLNRESRTHYSDVIQHLNNVPPQDGWFTKHYGGIPNGGVAVQQDGLKKPWQIHNTRKLDGIRAEIDNLSLSTVERAVALTSLILALDRVDSTLGHFVSYLKDWSPRSYNEMQLDVPKLFPNTQSHEVLCEDIFNVVDREVDLAYYDPPYGSNNEKMPPSRVRYASYYHLWTTICLNDSPPLFGKALRRRDTSDTVAASVFEDFRRNPNSGHFIAVEAIERLIQSTNARWIILSYSSGGRATADELNDMLSSNANVVDVIELDYKRNVMAGMKWTNEWLRDAESPNREFLFLIDKG
jgi:adenine-specific DNA-methyltransferase